MSKTIFLIIMLLIVFSGIIVGCASMDRSMKSFESDINGGLNRTVTVYDYNGNEIKSYTGMIDLEESESNDKVLFDLNGKRTIIHGGIVVIQEN